MNEINGMKLKETDSMNRGQVAHPCEAKIHHFQVEIVRGGEYHVLGLQVAMHDALTMINERE